MKTFLQYVAAAIVAVVLLGAFLAFIGYIGSMTPGDVYMR